MSAKIAIIVPTVGRQTELRRMLSSLAAQTHLPDQVIIVGETKGSEALRDEFPSLRPEFVYISKGSTCQNRNAGVRSIGPNAEVIGFLDDDIVLEPQALHSISSFWENAPADVGGAGCNLMNHPPIFASRLKFSRLASSLRLYNDNRGVVLQSGVHTLIGNLRKSTDVMWLPNTAVFYSRRVLEEFALDEWFEGYSYLEDLEFSYRVGKKHRLAVVAEARFYHYPSPVGRPDSYLFGKMEVLNRLHFVRKNEELSRPLCYLALFMRTLVSTFLGITKGDSRYIKRVAGNFAGMLLSFRTETRLTNPKAKVHSSTV